MDLKGSLPSGTMVVSNGNQIGVFTNNMTKKAIRELLRELGLKPRKGK